MNLSENQLTLEQVPKAICILNAKIDGLLQILSGGPITVNGGDQWFDIDEVRKYIPGNPAKPTIYFLVSKRDIPFYKKGKRLHFLKSEIDEWLKQDRKLTNTEIKQNATSFLKK